jgi:hypothetical protein
MVVATTKVTSANCEPLPNPGQFGGPRASSDGTLESAKRLMWDASIKELKGVGEHCPECAEQNCPEAVRVRIASSCGTAKPWAIALGASPTSSTGDPEEPGRRVDAAAQHAGFLDFGCCQCEDARHGHEYIDCSLPFERAVAI